MDDTTAALLANVIARESRSLLQYVSESFPWTTPDEQNVPAGLSQMSTEERRGAAALGQLLFRRRHEAPYLGPYPVSFTNINYVSLDHLLPMLVQQQRAAIKELQSDLARINDAEAREKLEKILAMKQRHLTQLEQMSSRTREAVVR